MKSSQFEAKTFGVGELITQRKLFRVPQHQRSYSWSRDIVTSFLEDIDRAFASDASEYFIGLLVIQGPEDGEWILLDGQQRLTTTTMIFASIRNWLNEYGFNEDAKQIESEFLGVRRLGGEYSSRMLLNSENQSTFTSVVLGRSPTKELEKNLKNHAKRSSNRYIVEGSIECQAWIDNVAKSAGSNNDDRARALFKLASFIESRVKVVCVEVSNDVDAYVLFESLNDRGVELSALDLVKNYIYSKVINPQNADDIHSIWLEIVDNLDEKNPDDFLKVFWTSRFGVVQKAQLFRRMRDKYQSPDQAESLLRQLYDDVAILSAFEDTENIFWNSFPDIVREYLYTLNLLGSKQVRPVLLAAVHKNEPELFATILWSLIVVVVRFQIVGRGRTGIMEKVFGKLCEGLSNGSIYDNAGVQFALQELHLEDDEFIRMFSSHVESKLSRTAYFLYAIEEHVKGTPRNSHIHSLISVLADTALRQIIGNHRRGTEDVAPALLYSIGNFAILEKEIALKLRDSLLEDSYRNAIDEANSSRIRIEVDVFEKSSFSLSREAADILRDVDKIGAISRRSQKLAVNAASLWRFN